MRTTSAMLLALLDNRRWAIPASAFRTHGSLAGHAALLPSGSALLTCKDSPDSAGWFGVCQRRRLPYIV
jgi:hypothetical protein